MVFCFNRRLQLLLCIFVGLRHLFDKKFSTPTKESPQRSVSEHKRFRPSMDSPGYSALVASKWFGSQTPPNGEDEPGHIDHVKEAVLG